MATDKLTTAQRINMTASGDTTPMLALSPDVSRLDVQLEEHRNQFGDEKDEVDDAVFSLSCWQKVRFFMKQTCNDIKSHWCQFCLSLCSVFVVVLSILVVVSITQKGPIVFLRLAEKFSGSYDGVIGRTDRMFVNE